MKYLKNNDEKNCWQTNNLFSIKTRYETYLLDLNYTQYCTFVLKLLK